MNKEKLFKEKISILNAEFVDFIRSAVKENPAYDLSPPLRDYLEHVKELDKMYAERPVLVAKRKNKDTAKTEKPKPSPVKKEEPKKLPGGLVEPPGQFNFAPKIQMPEIPKPKDTPTLSFSAPKSNSTPLSQSRKRRPDQPLDYDKMLSGKSDDYEKEDKPPEEPAKPLGQFLFGSSKPKETSTPTFNFGQSNPNATPEMKNGNSSDKGSSLFAGLTKPTGQFLFGSSTQKGTSTEPNLNSTPTQESKNNTSSDAAKGVSLFAGLTKPTGQFLFNSSNKETPSLTPSEPKSTSSPLSQESKTTEGSGKLNLFGGLVKPPEGGKISLFGGLVKPSEDGKPNLFGGLTNSASLFAPKPQSENNGEEQDKDEPEEPPKFDAVQHDEPDAVFTTKCSLHNFAEGQYKKAGTGFIYIKKSDKGPQLLIRAATTLGNVLVNTYINDSFKAEKKDKDRIQFSYPTADGIKTHLAKVVDVQGTLDYFTGTKKP